MQLQFVVEVEEKTTFSLYLFIAKVNFSVIIFNSGFRFPVSGFRLLGFRLPVFRVAPAVTMLILIFGSM